jgi:hypothetical protein
MSEMCVVLVDLSHTGDTEMSGPFPSPAAFRQWVRNASTRSGDDCDPNTFISGAIAPILSPDEMQSTWAIRRVRLTLIAYTAQWSGHSIRAHGLAYPCHHMDGILG